MGTHEVKSTRVTSFVGWCFKCLCVLFFLLRGISTATSLKPTWGATTTQTQVCFVCLCVCTRWTQSRCFALVDSQSPTGYRLNKRPMGLACFFFSFFLFESSLLGVILPRKPESEGHQPFCGSPHRTLARAHPRIRRMEEKWGLSLKPFDEPCSGEVGDSYLRRRFWQPKPSRFPSFWRLCRKTDFWKERGKNGKGVLGVDSNDSWQSSLFSSTSRFPVPRGFLERRIPGKNEERHP